VELIFYGSELGECSPSITNASVFERAAMFHFMAESKLTPNLLQVCARRKFQKIGELTSSKNQTLLAFVQGLVRKVHNRKVGEDHLIS
jgi:hypothetical protein